jgi:hypothetical protein
MLGRAVFAIVWSSLGVACGGDGAPSCADVVARLGLDTERAASVRADCEAASWTAPERRCVRTADGDDAAWACVRRGAFAGAAGAAPAGDWTDVRRRDHAGERCGSESEQRPAWIASDARLSATCRDDGGALECVGVSSFWESRPFAMDEARSGAYDAAAEAIARRLTDPALAPAVSPGRDGRETATLGFDAARLADDDAYADAAATLRAGRSETARHLRTRLGAAAREARYWEVYKDRGERRFLAFVRVEVDAAALEAVSRHYAQKVPMLGATLGVSGPLHPWFDEDFPDGVVVLDPGTSAFAGAGVPAGGVIVAGHDRKPVADAEALVAQCKAVEQQSSYITVAVRTDPRAAPVTYDVRLDGAGGEVAAVTGASDPMP